MFVAEETRLKIGLTAAQARLANLAHGALAQASQQSHDEIITGMLVVGPLGSVPGLSRQVTVSFLDLVIRQGQAVLGIRWHAAGPGGRLFPALDGNLVLTADGPDATVLRVEGVYRPPLGSVGARLDKIVLNRVAAATIRSFADRVADAIVNAPGPRALGPQEADADPWPPPEHARAARQYPPRWPCSSCCSPWSCATGSPGWPTAGHLARLEQNRSALADWITLAKTQADPGSRIG